MKLIFLILMPILAQAQMKSESFIIQIKDRKMSVITPKRTSKLFSVIVENRSLSGQVGKFLANGIVLKYVSVDAGQSKVVEIENKTGASITFVPVSPAFQEVPLYFGKKAYEIPSE